MSRNLSNNDNDNDSYIELEDSLSCSGLLRENINTACADERRYSKKSFFQYLILIGVKKTSAAYILMLITYILKYIYTKFQIENSFGTAIQIVFLIIFDFSQMYLTYLASCDTSRRLERIEISQKVIIKHLDSMQTQMNSMQTQMNSMQTQMDSMQTQMNSMQACLDTVLRKLDEMDRKMSIPHTYTDNLRLNNDRNRIINGNCEETPLQKNEIDNLLGDQNKLRKRIRHSNSE